MPFPVRKSSRLEPTSYSTVAVLLSRALPHFATANDLTRAAQSYGVSSLSPRNLPPTSLPFDNGDVPINRQICEAVHAAAWLGPFHFQPVDFFALPQAQHHAGIVGGQIASASYLHAAALEIAGLITYARANRIRIRLSCPRDSLPASDSAFQYCCEAATARHHSRQSEHPPRHHCRSRPSPCLEPKLAWQRSDRSAG